ncbi:MAG: helix-turn-helix domain-containing protein [Candidatus Limnocylindrales bacterium]
MTSIYERAYRLEHPRVHDTPTPEMVLIGARFRHGRRKAGLTQRQVAARSGVSQSLVSRFERGRTPGMSTIRVIRIGLALGPGFPFGCCPHQHKCAWPYNPDAERKWYEILNG